MSFARSFEKAFRWLLPTPFAIALILTAITMVWALLYGTPPASDQGKFWTILQAWYQGLWNGPLIIFMVQMMLILVLGHALALAPAINGLIKKIMEFSTNPATLTALVCFFTLLVAFFNWGLGLIFGAIMARKTGEHLSKLGKRFNYGVVGAAGYTGLMVWHGGISGSAPIKVAEEGHLKNMVTANLPAEYLSAVPNRLGFEETIFSGMNITATALLLVLLPLLAWWLAKKAPARAHDFTPTAAEREPATTPAFGAEKIDRSKGIGLLVGLAFLTVAALLAWQEQGLSFITPNFINFTLLGLALSFHKSFQSFLKAIDEAISGAAGILIQFPLYFGIMGIMSSTGLITGLSNFFSSVATAESFPVFTFFSAGLINIFVPSGGGQWAIQGPVLIQTAQNLEISLSKSIMALAYGDQLTNMLQPFWALPLLGITGLKAREIVPYTLGFLLLGLVIFIGVLLLF